MWDTDYYKMSIADIQKLLQSNLRLERDKGIVLLKTNLSQNDNQETSATLLKRFCEELEASNSSTAWQIVHGCLLGSKCIFEASMDLSDKTNLVSQSQIIFFQKFSLDSLQHKEVRVRTVAGEVLGVLCRLHGSKIYLLSQEKVLKLLKGDLERHIEGDDVSNKSDHNAPKEIANQQDLKSKIFHESAGWRFLETTMKCLRSMIEGCGKSFNEFINQELLDLLFCALMHTNRFVRETGFNVCSAIVLCGNSSDGAANNSVVKYGQEFAKYFAKGLADNWSQVRLASSIATRSFLLSFSNLEDCERYFPALLPRLCLNRYYIAEGVRIYSQDTWRMVSKEQGKELVEKYIADVVNYYTEATQADNHAVREAACACISELAVKIDPSVVRQYVPKLLDALLQCFQDDSWPVRDAACVACGNFILSFAAEAQDKETMLYSLFLGNLKDPIPSVREGAGVALAKYVKAFGDKVLPKVVDEITQGLLEVKNQPQNADKFVGLDKRPVQFGIAKNIHEENLDKKHTDQQMYSCGSLAPKMGRGSRGGCSDAKFRRPSEPWERSDGSIYLLSELSQHYPQQMAQLFPNVIKALSFKHYSQHLVFLETVCKQLPKIANCIGKRSFKMHLETFLDPIFEAVACDVQLTVAAGEDCVIQLGKFLGPSILRGRIENYNGRYLGVYDNIVRRSGQSPSNFSIPSGHFPYKLPKTA